MILENPARCRSRTEHRKNVCVVFLAWQDANFGHQAKSCRTVCQEPSQTHEYVFSLGPTMHGTKIQVSFLPARISENPRAVPGFLFSMGCPFKLIYTYLKFSSRKSQQNIMPTLNRKSLCWVTIQRQNLCIESRRTNYLLLRLRSAESAHLHWKHSLYYSIVMQILNINAIYCNISALSFQFFELQQYIRTLLAGHDQLIPRRRSIICYSGLPPYALLNSLKQPVVLILLVI